MKRFALLLNGIYDFILEDILEAQCLDPVLVLYLQPYHNLRIKGLDQARPSRESPIPFWATTTTDLSRVHWKGQIVGWNYKPNLTPEEVQAISATIRGSMKHEDGMYLQVDSGRSAVNLIHVLGVTRVEEPFSTALLTKLSDGQPAAARTRAGGWAYVQPRTDR